jgi:hypothetical protein
MKRMVCNNSRWKAANQSKDGRIRRRWIFKMLLAQHCITSQKRRIFSNTNNRTSCLAKTVITFTLFFSKVKKLILVQEQYISVN